MIPTVPQDRTTPPAAPAVELRASDAERLAVAEVLQDAVGRGLLTPAEGSDRTAAAWAAVYRHQLPPLTSDLPPTTPAADAPSWGQQAQHRALRLWTMLLAAVTSMTPKRRLIAATVLVILVAALVGFGLFDSGDGDHGPSRGLLEHGQD